MVCNTLEINSLVKSKQTYGDRMNAYPSQEGNFADKENRQRQQQEELERGLKEHQITEEEKKRQREKTLP